jgi:GT2 family glycosyltransferase
MAMSFGVVVVHWRGAAETLACLRSIAAAGGRPAAVVAAENGPGDLDGAAARDACPGLDIVRLPENRGYAAGCNAGAREAFARGADAVLLLNNDVTIDSGTLEALAALFDAHPRAAIAGLPVVYADDPARVWFAGGRLHRRLGYTRHTGFQSRDLPRKTTPVDFVTGAAIAVRRDAWERLGGLDEAYFHYFEDADLCERARLAGYECWLAPSPPARHLVSASAGIRGSNRLTRDQAYYFARNRMRFVRRDFRGARRITALLAQPTLVAYESAKALAQGNTAEARGRIEGLLAGLRGRTGPRARA